ncbi:MAG: sodium ion-translocating decarboxylase subunit beta, partial [Candidatus Cloacimonetes bacterium]|nr:sodium ion-translocating decarboxylase subunit beta [Candidatus Cloacimonadota bacterium]
MEFWNTIYRITSFSYGFSWQQALMIFFSLILAYIAISKKKEPYLLLPLAFGMLLANIPGAKLDAYTEGGLLHLIYQGIRPTLIEVSPGVFETVFPNPSPLYPPMIFLCLGVMTDFSPLISNPKTIFISICGQIGIFAAFLFAILIGKFVGGPLDFNFREAASIAIIGGADGPTSIFVAAKLAPELLSTVAIAAFSYMGLVPFIQPPIMKMLTTDAERLIKMKVTQPVPQRTKIIFAFSVTIGAGLLIPSGATLVGMLMLGNIIRECGVLDRFIDTLTQHFLNLLTIFVSFAIGSSAIADYFLTAKTICVLLLGLSAFYIGTFFGVLSAKLLNLFPGAKVNPLIGNAGVSAMPMAARISQKLGQQYDKHNHLLMHAMGPLVGAIIASAVVAGIF